jgi:hypothetical protein
MTAAFELVRANLLRCTPEERTKLKMLITRHPGTAAKKAAVSVNEVQSDWLLQGTLAELKRRGHKHYVESYAQIRSLCTNYELTSQEIREQLEQQVRKRIEAPTRSQLLTLGTVSARALADYIHAWSPVGLKPMLQFTGRTLEALDNSFPEYLQSGMIGCLIDLRL